MSLWSRQIVMEVETRLSAEKIRARVERSVAERVRPRLENAAFDTSGFRVEYRAGKQARRVMIRGAVREAVGIVAVVGALSAFFDLWLAPHLITRRVASWIRHTLADEKEGA
jgi:hypothetical protein